MDDTDRLGAKFDEMAGKIAMDCCVGPDEMRENL